MWSTRKLLVARKTLRTERLQCQAGSSQPALGRSSSANKRRPRLRPRARQSRAPRLIATRLITSASPPRRPQARPASLASCHQHAMSLRPINNGPNLDRRPANALSLAHPLWAARRPLPVPHPEYDQYTTHDDVSSQSPSLSPTASAAPCAVNYVWDLQRSFREQSPCIV